jgi:hypothetical protein
MRPHIHGGLTSMRMYPYMYMYNSLCIYVHVSACVCMHGVLLRLCMCAYILTSLYAVDCVCMGTYPCMYICIYTYVYVYVCMGTYPCMHVCMHVCTCTYPYMYGPRMYVHVSVYACMYHQ